MNGAKFNKTGGRQRILIAPLEWGLGHATRCIPVIKALLEMNCEVIIAAEKESEALLRMEFPQLPFLPLKGYRIQYSRKKIWLPFKLLFQFPKIAGRIGSEQRWLRKVVVAYQIDAVISDNRFGLYHSSIPSVYITHQLTIETGNRFTRWVAQKIHYHYINKYSACWVPDAEGGINLAGKLSHPEKLPGIPVHYIGPLSRFEKKTLPKKYDLLVCLSGPEPQRTIFEDILLQQLILFPGKVLLVRGLPGGVNKKEPDQENIEMVSHLSAEMLNTAIEQSEMLIARSGYTTIMDLVKLQHKAILVPTPGQKEQEYLAELLLQQKLFYCCTQHNFSLQQSLKAAAGFSAVPITIDQDAYKKTVVDFINRISGARTNN